MSEVTLADRIVADPEVCFGKPRIQGTRITVSDILSALAAGDTPEDIVDAFPYVSVDDIRAALTFAAESLGRQVQVAA